MTRPDTGKGDTRLKRQAKALQEFIGTLMEPPMEPADNPLVDIKLSPREIKVLLRLGDRGEMIMTDLATTVSAPLSTLTRMIDRLEKKQFVERFRSAEDRRIVIVKEGEKGKILRHRFRGLQLEMAVRMLQPLTNGERENLLALLGKMSSGLKAAKE